MNTVLNGVSNQWTALVFGAVFNWLMASPDETLIAFVIKTVIGGVIWLCFQIIADRVKNRNAAKLRSEEHTRKTKKKKT